MSAVKYSSWARNKAVPVQAAVKVEDILGDDIEMVEETASNLAPAAVPNISEGQPM